MLRASVYIAASLCASTSTAAHVNQQPTASKHSLTVVGTVARSDMLEPLIWSRQSVTIESSSMVTADKHNKRSSAPSLRPVVRSLFTSFVAIANFEHNNEVMNEIWLQPKSNPDLLSKRGQTLTTLAAGTALLQLRGGAWEAALVPATVLAWNLLVLSGEAARPAMRSSSDAHSTSLTLGQRIAIGHLTKIGAGSGALRLRGGAHGHATSSKRAEAILLAWDLFMRLGMGIMAPFQ